jgi:hypothetical protein
MVIVTAMAMFNTTYGASVMEGKAFVGLSEHTWICSNKVEAVQDALTRIPLNHMLVAVNPKYFSLNDGSWNLLLIKARKFDMLVDENNSVALDSNGIKQARDGFFLISNTAKSNAFVKQWSKQTQAKAAPTNGHPTLFSSILSDLRGKDKAFRVSGLVWPLPLDWSATLSPSKQLSITSTVQPLKILAAPCSLPINLSSATLDSLPDRDVNEAESVFSESPRVSDWEEFTEGKDLIGKQEGGE